MRVILHADDFGMNTAVTDGICALLRGGAVTSTSLLANAPDAVRAIACHRLLPPRCTPPDLGVHLNLTQGRPLTPFPSEWLDASGCFRGVFYLFRVLTLRAASRRLGEAIFRELDAQIGLLADHGIRPTHVNGHQYVELMPVVADLLPKLMRRHAVQVLRVPREQGLWRSSRWGGSRLGRYILGRIKQRMAIAFGRRVEAWSMARAGLYFGTIHAGKVDADVLRCYLETARLACDDGGVPGQHVEIGLHPGMEATPRADADDSWHDPLAADRPRELAMLRASSTAELLDEFGVELSSFRDAFLACHRPGRPRAA